METLAEAQEWLRDNLDEGARCPCCTQFAKVYKRPIHSAMAHDLIAAYRRYGALEWFFLPDLMGDRGTGDFAKLRYWGLVEPQEGEREDGSNRVGVWRITATGEAFVLRRQRVPRHALVYDGRYLRAEGDLINIVDALGHKFDYNELMRGYAQSALTA